MWVTTVLLCVLAFVVGFWIRRPHSVAGRILVPGSYYKLPDSQVVLVKYVDTDKYNDLAEGTWCWYTLSDRNPDNNRRIHHYQLPMHVAQTYFTPLEYKNDLRETKATGDGT